MNRIVQFLADWPAPVKPSAAESAPHAPGVFRLRNSFTGVRTFHLYGEDGQFIAECSIQESRLSDLSQVERVLRALLVLAMP